MTRIALLIAAWAASLFSVSTAPAQAVAPAAPAALSAQAAALSPAVREFVAVGDPVVALTHVRIIDGTGGPAREDQTLVISGGAIAAMGPSASTAPPAGSKVIDLAGASVIPGIVGLHDHIFYPAGGAHYNTLEYTAPRLYLACGVTTIRTTGSLEPFTELGMKKAIERGAIPGPRMRVTSPYLEGAGAFTLQMNVLEGPDDAVRFVRYWDSEGVDDFKCYMNIRHDDLAAAVAEIHRLGKKITGHLGSIGFREAAALGIDGLEHGLLADSEFTPGKARDVSPPSRDVRESLMKIDLASPEVRDMIADLVARKVAITSTLPVIEVSVPGRPPLQPRILEAMGPEARLNYLTARARIGEQANPPMAVLLRKEMDFERAFVRAGGLLLAGPDPTGPGGVLPGFGDQRGIELLVDAGFTPLEAVSIATSNGAKYLGLADRLGTLAPGKAADLVVIAGDPSRSIADVEKVRMVFKDGVGYDPAKLLDSVRGQLGMR